MLIDVKDGGIKFDSPEMCFSRDMTLLQFQKSSFFSSFKLSSDLDPSFTYRCESAEADGRTFDIWVRFYSGVIDSLSLGIVRPPRPDGDEYYHWNYLRQILGHQPEDEYFAVEYTYEWGGVSVDEVKSESNIIIRYVA